MGRDLVGEWPFVDSGNVAGEPGLPQEQELARPTAGIHGHVAERDGQCGVETGTWGSPTQSFEVSGGPGNPVVASRAHLPYPKGDFLVQRVSFGSCMSMHLGWGSPSRACPLASWCLDASYLRKEAGRVWLVLCETYFPPSQQIRGTQHDLKSPFRPPRNLASLGPEVSHVAAL